MINVFYLQSVLRCELFYVSVTLQSPLNSSMAVICLNKQPPIPWLLVATDVRMSDDSFEPSVVFLNFSTQIPELHIKLGQELHF